MKKVTEKSHEKVTKTLKSQKKVMEKNKTKRIFFGPDNQCKNEEQSRFHFNDEEMSYSEIKFCP